MSSEWMHLPIGECLEKVIDNRGKTPPIAEAETPYGLIEINAIVGANKHPDYASVRKYVAPETYGSWFRAGHPKIGDVLFSTVGSIAEVAIFNGGNGCIAQNLVGLRPKRAVVEPDYLYYVLINPSTRGRLKTLDISSVQPSIKVPHLLATEIAVPTLAIQQEITSVLSSLDDRITLLRETNATLEAIAQAIFKSWFVDFDPVRAKQEGRAPEGMDEATAALFPDSFEESALGLAPRGWGVATIGDVSSQIFSGGTPDTRKPEYWSGDVPWFSSGETRNRVIIHTEKTINQLAVENSSTKLSLHGDVLIASAGQGHTRGQTSYCAITTYINQSVVALRANPEVCDSLWLYYNLSRRYAEMRDLSDSHSSRGSLTTKLLAGMRAIVPRREVCRAFANVADTLMESQVTNEQQAKTLASLRDTLLPRLISGQLRLPEAASLVEETE